MDRINGMTIIHRYLVDNGFDGLQNDNECGCELDDLMPCSDNIAFCKPGYKVIPPDWVKTDYDFYICENKDDKPWE
jgi:hypothetical protein